MFTDLYSKNNFVQSLYMLKYKENQVFSIEICD